jgi:hypothetical protein
MTAAPEPARRKAAPSPPLPEADVNVPPRVTINPVILPERFRNSAYLDLAAMRAWYADLETPWWLGDRLGLAEPETA